MSIPAAAADHWRGKLWRETCRPFRPQTWQKWRRTLLGERGKPFRLEVGSVEPEGLAFLAELVKQSRQHSGPIVEIGTLLGRTTTHLAIHKAREQQIITVDTYVWNPWGLSRSGHHALASLVLGYLLATGQVRQLKMNKNDFYRAYSGPPPALVFLDAVHTYEETLRDLAWARACGAAIIAGHDYSPRFPGVVRAVDEVGGPKQVQGTVFVL